jgi:hypothetical protein
MKKEAKQSRHGGFSFYLSLVIQFLLILIILPAVIHIFFSKGIFQSLGFLIAMLAGIACTPFIIAGKLRVFIHEWKHSFISSLAGNRARGMKIESETGHFEFAYTKRSAHNNAFIALAPYFVPVFSPLALALAAVFLRDYQYLQRIIVGFFFGIDLFCNWYDVSPVQTDLSQLRGGFSIGVFFAAVSNLILLLLFLTWAAAGFEGWRTLISAVGDFSRALFVKTI